MVYICRNNVSFLVGDATEMDLSEGSVDVVFSNWLLMYLDDAECEQLASDALAWVRCLPLHPQKIFVWSLCKDQRTCVLPA